MVPRPVDTERIVFTTFFFFGKSRFLFGHNGCIRNTIARDAVIIIIRRFGENVGDSFYRVRNNQAKRIRQEHAWIVSNLRGHASKIRADGTRQFNALL